MQFKFLKRLINFQLPKENEWERSFRNNTETSIKDITSKVKSIELNTLRQMQTRLLGDYKSRFKGQGMQFADFRVYNFGDDTRHIDWRASAKSQQTLIKTFEEERELNIICAVDVSDSNLFGSQKSTKAETLSLSIATIAFSAIKNNDRVGLLLFSDSIEKYVPPKKGKKHVLRLIDEIVRVSPKSYKTNLDVAIDYMIGVLNHSAVIFLASDFLDRLDKHKLRLLTKRHDVIAVFTTDPRDFELPDMGLVQFIDPETREIKVIDTSNASFRNNLKQTQIAAYNSTKEYLSRNNVSVLEISTEMPAADQISKFFHKKRVRK